MESQGLLYAHLNDHENNKSQFTCDSCELVFTTQITLEKHNNETHISQDVLHSDEWNCNDCPFQGNNISELMNHLKLSGHQPSETDEVKRSIFDDYKQCYTCKLEFNGYYNLMNHRKSVHPSNKRCKNYPVGKCQFDKKCWYVHEEDLMDVDESFRNDEVIKKIKCYICAEIFKH